MFNVEFIKSLKKTLLFFMIYTSLFALIYFTSSYTFPFIVAFAIAFLIQPITKFFRIKLKFKRNAPALLASAIVYILIFALLAFLFYSIISEAMQLVKNLSAANLDKVVKPIQNAVHEISQYFQNIDPSFIEDNSSQLTQILKNSLNIVGKGLNTFLSIALSIPMWITIIFVVILSTYFFTRDMSSIKRRFVSVFSESGKEKIEKIWSQGISMLTRYVKAYFLIYFLTFIQTFIGFTILGVKYSVLLSIICAFADILPVLGIGLVYLPLATIYIFSGNYFAGFGILILFVLISIIRQIVEPKIVSTSLGIHPVATLVAIFIGLKAYGIIGMVYLTFMIVFYKVLKKKKII
jgi:sporulation integral membrane protein YtvI